jgi:MFS family permease
MRPLTDRVFYGWVVVFIFLVTGTTLYGIHFSFGVFFKSIEAEFDLTRAATSTIVSVNMLLAGLFSFLAGWTMDRYGPRFVVLLMGVFTGLSLVLTSLTSSLWQLFFTYSLLLAMGTGAIYVVPMSAVSRWFDRKRGLAMGVSSMGIGLGTMVMAPFATYLITGYNWHTAYLVIGLIAWIIVVPLSGLLKKDPAEIGALPDGVKEVENTALLADGTVAPVKSPVLAIIRSRNFWLITCIHFFFAACVFFVFSHLVPHVTDMGFTPIEAALVISLLGAASIPGRLFMGIASDRIGRKKASIICALFMAVSIFWLIWARDLWSLYLFAVVYGFFYSGFGSSTAALISVSFDLRNIGAVFGLLEMGIGLGAATGSAVGGYIFDISHSYEAAFLTIALAMLVAALLFTMVKRKATLLNQR